MHHLHTVPPANGLSIVAVSMERPGQRIVKRALDIVGAGTLFLALFPLMLLIALLIKCTSRGPALFRQLRLGQGGRQFTMLKFRTMVDCAAEVRQCLVHQSHASPPLFKIEKDPRVTSVGALLRVSFVDELPQLLNVIRGEMSLVGPRPILPSESALFFEKAAFRFSVPQGITGPWQVGGQHHLTFEEQIEIERQYVGDWSLSKDLAIAMKTIPVVLKRAGV
jgi:lipopolysaccharide/colanic/teichoic acid biosynthesis glycosyltransferase